MKYIYILISSALVIYLILLTLIYVNQRKLLYLPSENNYLDDPINFNYKELFIEVDKNIKLKSGKFHVQAINETGRVIFGRFGIGLGEADQFKGYRVFSSKEVLVNIYEERICVFSAPIFLKYTDIINDNMAGIV